MSGRRAVNNFNGDHQLSLRRRCACEDLAALSHQQANIPLGTGTVTQEPIVAATQPNVQPVAVAINQTPNGVGVGNATQVANQNPYIVYGTYSSSTLANNYSGFPPNQQSDHQIYQPSNQQLNPHVYQPTQQLGNYQSNQQSNYQLQPNNQPGQQLHYQHQQPNYQQNQQLSSLGGWVISLPAGAGAGIGINSTGENSNLAPGG